VRVFSIALCIPYQDITGLAVHVASELQKNAEPNEILITQTVKI